MYKKGCCIDRNRSIAAAHHLFSFVKKCIFFLYGKNDMRSSMLYFTFDYLSLAATLIFIGELIEKAYNEIVKCGLLLCYKSSGVAISYCYCTGRIRCLHPATARVNQRGSFWSILMQ